MGSDALHMCAYRNVDLGLDPFPYHGTTTTCDAQAMGVPVVSQVGLTGWITLSQDEHVERAIEYARQPELLRRLRGSLRGRLVASDLGRPDRFARSMEDAWRRIWPGLLCRKVNLCLPWLYISGLHRRRLL
jgi:protein O-GlcNAc transferase